ncbi:MAG: hypothetical protein EXR67_04645 [Dehalococcoidia bacterium]|nr:hypothetical protein [Dehalococcoidia bacterium]
MEKRKNRDTHDTITVEQALDEMLEALVRAHYDRRRPAILERGIEERDLAFEAGMLVPLDMEMTIYATQRRNRILRLLREMEQRGWCSMETRPPMGAYFIKVLPAGEAHLAEKIKSRPQPWWQRLFGSKNGR